MLFTRTSGEGEITIFMLHWLGGSGSSWQEVTNLLKPHFRCVQIDLPGFGSSSSVPGYSIQEMAAAVIEVIKSIQPASWMLAGHSMGAKIAATIAREAERGNPALEGLLSLALFAGSPPAPEPMDEARRAKMTSWFTGSADESLKQAIGFVQANSANRLAAELERATIRTVLQTDRAAWQAWLDSGSREDWSTRIGVLGTPAIIVAGELDPDLGPAAQRELMLPHFAQGQLRVVPGTKHLLPLEAPEAVAGFILEASRLTPQTSAHGQDIPSSYRALIASDRVSSRTRSVLLERAHPDSSGYQPVVLRVEQLATLRALAARVIPQPQETRDLGTWIDFAARIDRQLATGIGNGWRYDVLPSDADSYRLGLDTLNAEAKQRHAAAFVSCTAAQQDSIIQAASTGDLGGSILRSLAGGLGLSDNAASHPHLEAAQMKRWLEEVRGDLTRAYMSQPSTLARIGYSGIADGGQTDTMNGFVLLEPGQHEAWEPESTAYPHPERTS